MLLKKLLITVCALLITLISFYLVLPFSPISDLPEAVKSDEPGDTVQLKGVSGFYTNTTDREAILAFYRNEFSQTIFGLKLPIIRLNHPPEKAKEVFVDTKQSYWLEELVSPFRGSLFVNGFEWEKDVFTAPDKRVKNKLLFNSIEYKNKISLKTAYPNPLFRLFVFWASLYLAYLLAKNWVKLAKSIILPNQTRDQS